MALRVLSKVLLPNFERELSGSIATQVATVPAMVDNFMAPQAFCYDTRASSSMRNTTGAFATTGAMRQGVKVDVPIKVQGMFADQPSWHK